MSLQSDLAASDADFRRRQGALQAGIGILVRERFKQIPVEDIMADGISPPVENWLRQSTAIAGALRRRSQADGRDLYDRVAELVNPTAAPFVHPDPEPFDPESLRQSMIVTGLVRSRKRIGAAPGSFLDPESPEGRLLEQGRQAQIDEAISSAADAAGAAAGRHVMNGAREQIVESSTADPRTVGYVRVTSSKPCFFCAALASRGGVYDDDSFEESDARFTGPGQIKVHDYCSCSYRPVFSRRRSELPELNQSFTKRWDDLAKDLGRAPAMIDWRRIYENRSPVYDRS